MIHPTAIIHPGAQIGPECVIGPYVVIDAHVVLGRGCRLGPQVYLTGHTEIGPGNVFHAGCVIGDAPQDLKYAQAPTRLRMGEGNTVREHATVHRSTREDSDTIIRNGNLLMAGSHVGHNCVLGDSNIVANGALLAGHATLADRVFVSGNCLVHQFCRIGRLAMMQGSSGISKDLPPFCIARGANGIAGLNTVGLRRAGVLADDRLSLRRTYHLLFRSDRRRDEALAAAREQEGHNPLARELIEFVATARRGVCVDTGRRGGAESESE